MHNPFLHNISNRRKLCELMGKKMCTRFESRIDNTSMSIQFSKKLLVVFLKITSWFWKRLLKTGKREAHRNVQKDKPLFSENALSVSSSSLITTKDKSKNKLRSNKDDDDDGVKANANLRIIRLCIVSIPLAVACSTYSKFWIFI